VSVPAGWYPDPSGRPGSRYWDGAGWSDAVAQDLPGQPQQVADAETAYSLPPVTPGGVPGAFGHPDLGAGFRTLGRWLTGLLFSYAGVGALVGLGAAIVLLIGRDGAVDITSLQSSEVIVQVFAVLNVIGGICNLASIVLWLVWQHRLASNGRVHPTYLRRSPGWHIGSWFIPIVSLWFPYQNVKDLARGLMAPVDRWGVGLPDDGPERGVATRLLPWWWLAWLASSVAAQIESGTGGGVSGSSAGASSLAVTSMSWVTVASGLDVASGVLAALVVLAMTRAAISPPGQPQFPTR
jgi:hypothetical protein